MGGDSRVTKLDTGVMPWSPLPNCVDLCWKLFELSDKKEVLIKLLQDNSGIDRSKSLPNRNRKEQVVRYDAKV